MIQSSINELTSIILCNYPFYMNDLEDLQSNWNILEKKIDNILTKEVFHECFNLLPLYDILYYSQLNLSDNSFSMIVEKFKIYLKNLFAKTNKALIRIIQNYPEKIRNNEFYMFTENTANKIFKCESLNKLNECLNKNFNILYLLMTSARANIWKDNKIEISNQIMNSNNIEIAIIILMNSIFSYYGDYNQSGGKCFKIEFNGNLLNYTLSIENSKETYKKSSIELIKYKNPTLFISELLLNSQNPFENNYELIPSISAEMYSIEDIKQIAEDYKKQVNKEWNTFADILIGFDDKDTYKNQTFKRLVYNSVLQKVCNWTLFIPLNTFFDCSNINRIHEENNIKIKPTDLINNTEIKNNIQKLNIEELSSDIEELYKRATEIKPLGKTLKINCMTMSNPPTETEIKRYEAIKNNIN